MDFDFNQFDLFFSPQAVAKHMVAVSTNIEVYSYLNVLTDCFTKNFCFINHNGLIILPRRTDIFD